MSSRHDGRDRPRERDYNRHYDDRRDRDREGDRGRGRERERERERERDDRPRPTTDRDRDRSRDHHRGHDTRRSPPAAHAEAEGSFPATEEESTAPKLLPDYKVSGKLTQDTNSVNGIVLKYNEPSDARKPNKGWRLYPFKGTEELPVLHVHRQSAYLLGRERKVADIPLDHPSCSGQHAVLQFRSVNHEREDGVVVKRVKPYIIDLESANGTLLNSEKIDTKRYIELKAGDMLRFGFSTREYVLLNDDVDIKQDDEV